MDGEIVGVIAGLALNAGVMWYKIGRLEGKVSALCEHIRGRKNKAKGGSKRG